MYAVRFNFVKVSRVVIENLMFCFHQSAIVSNAGGAVSAHAVPVRHPMCFAVL